MQPPGPPTTSPPPLTERSLSTGTDQCRLPSLWHEEDQPRLTSSPTVRSPPIYIPLSPSASSSASSSSWTSNCFRSDLDAPAPTMTLVASAPRPNKPSTSFPHTPPSTPKILSRSAPTSPMRQRRANNKDALFTMTPTSFASAMYGHHRATPRVRQQFDKIQEACCEEEEEDVEHSVRGAHRRWSSCSEDSAQTLRDSSRSPHSRPGEMFLQSAANRFLNQLHISGGSPKRLPPAPPLVIPKSRKGGKSDKLSPTNGFAAARPLRAHRSYESLCAGRSDGKMLMLPAIPEATTPGSPLLTQPKRDVFQEFSEDDETQLNEQCRPETEDTTDEEQEAEEPRNSPSSWVPRALPRTFSG